MRAWVIASLLFGLTTGAGRAADFSTLRGEIADQAPASASSPPFTVGLRYWYSTGRHDYAFNASMADPTLGNPTSELKYHNVPAQTGEVFARYDDAETGLVAKGYLGGGFVSGGTVNDRDWFAGQQLLSNTNSSLKNSSLRYGTLDVGWGAEYLTFGRLQFLPFVGYGYWHDGVGIWGLTFLPDNFGGAFAAAPPGTVLFSASQKVGDYVASWNLLRLGTEATFTITQQLLLSVDAALVPYAKGSGDDSHLLRQDVLNGGIGPKPNVLLRGHGWGGQVDAMLHYQVTDALSLGLGGRYWYLDGSSGTETTKLFRLSDIKFPLTRFSSERYGALAEAAYKF